MAPMLVLLAAAASSDAALLAAYRAKTRAEVRCDATASSSEILVCGRRNADRYRVPFVTITPGDPAHEGVPQERYRLQARTTPCQDRGPFLVGCGSVGIGLKAGGGKTRVGGLRQLAP